MTLKFKIIRPKALNENVFQQAFSDATKQMAKEVHADFDEITASWRHAVPFEETISETARETTVSVLTDDLGFKYYDQGNGGPGRIITPTRAKALHWVDKSGQDVFRKSVRGYDGRKAVEKIEKMWAEKAPVLFELAMQKAAKESGNAI